MHKGGFSVNEKEQELVINEDMPSTEESVSISTEGLLPQEIELAKKHGIIPEVNHGKHVNEQSVESKPLPVEEEKQKEEVAPEFETVEKDESLISKYNSNEKALYWKWKSDKRKRQDIQNKYDEIIASNELEKVKDKVAQSKLKRVSDTLKDPNKSLTVDDLLAIINDGDTNNIPDDAKTLTVADFKKFEHDKQKIANENEEKLRSEKERYIQIENLGKAKHKDFTKITELAQEVASSKKSYLDMLTTAFNNKSIDEDELAEMIIDVARLNPKFKELDVSAKPEDKEVVNRAITNANKKTSSAAVGGSTSQRVVSESQLTVEDAAKLSPSQWRNLKESTRKRILSQT